MIDGTYFAVEIDIGNNITASNFWFNDQNLRIILSQDIY